MANNLGHRRSKVAGALAWAFLAGLAVAVTANGAEAQAPTTGYVDIDPAAQEPGFILQIFHNLFNSRALLDTLRQREFTLTALIVLNAIVFVETGLLVGFCRAIRY